MNSNQSNHSDGSFHIYENPKQKPKPIPKPIPKPVETKEVKNDKKRRE